VYSFGQNSRGQLGVGDTSVHWGPQLVGNYPGLLSAPEVTISAGEDHSLLLVKYPAYAANLSRFLVFGHNWCGGLGLPSGVNNATCQCVRTPTSNAFFDPQRTTAISAGWDHTLVLAPASSTVSLPSCFGWNSFGQLGLGSSPGTAVWSPITNDFWHHETVKAVSAGAGFSLVLVENSSSGASRVYSFGRNDYGQLGNGLIGGPQGGPQVVIGLPSGPHSIIAISAGGDHSLVLTATGDVYAFGRNDHGQLGLGAGSPPVKCKATLIGSIHGVTAISAGYAHSLFLYLNSVYSCGWNNAGQLGVGDKTDRLSPTPVPWSWNAIAISAGYSHSLAVIKETLGFSPLAYLAYSWGSNSQGQLGFSSTVLELLTPHLVVGIPSKVIAVSAGWNHSLVVRRW
jgi:alpha-tubulin suppressor-like RCC1 family protein